MYLRASGCRLPTLGNNYQLLILIYFWSVPFGLAQNLVPNPSFEVFHNCPPYLGQIQESIAWDSPNNNTTDYFHACAPRTSGASVPQNTLGEQPPAQGEAYAGLRTWIPVIAGNPVYREYLSTQLKTPLLAGMEYQVEFKVSLAESSSHATDDLSIYFSKQPLANERLYQVIPQIRNPSGHLLDDVTDWTAISGTFTAQGGETFLVIGTFLNDEEMTRTIVRPGQEPKVYYYIDDIKVQPCRIPEQLTQVIDTNLCAGQLIDLLGLPDAKAYRWDNLTTTINRQVRSPGKYEVISQNNCYDFTTIYQVEEENCICHPTVPSAQIIDFLGNTNRFAFSSNRFTKIKQLVVYDALGRQVHFSKGTDLSEFEAPSLSAGVYFYCIKFTCIDLLGNQTSGQQAGKFIAVQ